MYGDRHTPWVHRWRHTATAWVLPLQYTVDAPFRLVGHLRMSLDSREALLKANDALRVHALMLEARVQQLRLLKQENKQLLMNF